MRLVSFTSKQRIIFFVNYNILLTAGNSAIRGYVIFIAAPNLDITSLRFMAVISAFATMQLRGTAILYAADNDEYQVPHTGMMILAQDKFY